MAGREELYLKHIDENTGRIAKALEYMVTEDKKRKARKDKDRKWISCSERLPEHTGTYLVTAIVAVDKYVTTGWYSTKGGWICDGRTEAWMPLPEPYKKEKENESGNSGFDPLWDGR